jgi:hypothetical protein
MEKLLDVFEGSLDIDEEVIHDGGIVGLLIRLNHISGGNHKDTNFDAQWEQAKNFLRAPYYVYSPWNDGKTNFNWLMANLPENDVTLVMDDIEVLYPEYSSEVYADQVDIFTDLVKAQIHTIDYTGQWFLPTLSHWSTDIEYCWARYPNRFYSEVTGPWSYEKLELETERYGWYPDPQKKCPGTIKLWQCSGDRIKLPGCAGRAVDVILWNGNLVSLKEWWGITSPVLSKLDILWNNAVAYPPANWVMNP